MFAPERRAVLRKLKERLARHPFLSELMPTLEWEVESGHVLGFGWSALEDSIDARPGRPRALRPRRAGYFNMGPFESTSGRRLEEPPPRRTPALPS